MSQLTANNFKIKGISEIEQALAESQADMTAGWFVVESTDQHLRG